MMDAKADLKASGRKVQDLRSDYDAVEIEELDKSGNIQRRWIHESTGRIKQIRPAGKSNGIFTTSLHGWMKSASDAFLPVGFPYSVSTDYLRYQTFDSLQAFFSTISSLLANRALLQGLGVGDANSSATFALLLTILKDAMSRVATIVFAHRFGLRIEPDAKKFRFLADIFNDSAFFLELYSPYLSSWGKVVALSTGEALRALCGVAAGASKAALSVHFAKHDNLAELNAKEASQETAVGLIGLLVGTLVVRAIEDHTSVVYLMILLVLAHLWMNYLAVRSVQMHTLNRQRATILFQHYLASQTILTPTEVSQRESVLLWSPTVRNKQGDAVSRIEIAESYAVAAAASSSNSQVTRVLMADSDEHYSIFIHNRPPGQIRPIRILLHHNSDAQDAIRAWFKALEISWAMDSKKGFTAELAKLLSSKGPVTSGYNVSFASPRLWEAMESAGWDLTSQSLETGVPVRLRITKAKKDI